MKRIAILTLVFYNYGTRLQSYALCKILNRLFPEETSIEVINSDSPWRIQTNALKFFVFSSLKHYRLRAIKHILEIYKYLRESEKISLNKDHASEVKKRNDTFKSLIAQIPYTQPYSLDDIRAGRLPEYDAILVGSDQVWNGIKVGSQDVFMLDFLKGKKGLTYAASFGMTNIPAFMKDDYKRRIQNFDSLLIRESEGIRLCRELGRDDAQLVLDPTLLLEAGDYEDIISENRVVPGDYVLVYSLNYSYKIFTEAYRFSKRNACKMVVLKRSLCPPDIKEYEGAVELYAVSPEAFLRLIKDAKCVITNSYHALLFSLLFHRDFYLYLDNADEENSRLLTITRMCHLDKRVFWETDHLPKKISCVDYADADSILQTERMKSIQLLKESVCDYLHLSN